MDSATAHDLRSPLASIEGYARLLSEGRGGELTPKQRRYVEGILASSRILRHILDSLRLADELARGEIEPAEAPGSAGEILSRAAADFARAFAAKGARIEADGGDVFVPRGADLVERAVGPLLLAALTTSEPGCEIRLSARREASEIVVAVEGPGVAGPGTGAGLEVAARLAERLGGRADFQEGHLALILPAA